MLTFKKLLHIIFLQTYAIKKYLLLHGNEDFARSRLIKSHKKEILLWKLTVYVHMNYQLSK